VTGTRLSGPFRKLSQTFQEILARKKGYSVFLDQLKVGLLAFIDENEDRYGEKARKAS
jgi:hypothetical protein